jgi:hypothetical protein
VKPKNKPLTVRITRNGVLTIEIGVDALAFSALASPYAWQATDPKRTGKERDPREVFAIPMPRAFACDVKDALTDEAEDGSSKLTMMLDDAMAKAIEDGSEYFVDSEEAE